MTGMSGWLLHSPQNTWQDDNTVTTDQPKKVPQERSPAREMKYSSHSYKKGESLEYLTVLLE